MIKDSYVIEQKTFKSLLSSFIVFFFGGKLSMISCFCATALKGLVMIVSGKKVFSNQQTWQDVDGGGGGGHMWTYLAPTTITISTNVTHPTLNFPHYSSTNTLPTAISKPIQSWAAKIFRFNDLRRRCETLSGSQMSSLISVRPADQMQPWSQTSTFPKKFHHCTEENIWQVNGWWGWQKERYRNYSSYK